ncbi:MAG: signal recognition particle-docking protein FtsY [Ruminococcaceae bacterium]|nr:signal recognition particle-docking protein FtsY [Oscillospiraceae bacterium]
MGFFEKIKKGLTKTKDGMSNSLNGLFANFRTVDEDFLEELMEILITSDVGYEVSEKIIDELRSAAKLEKIKDTEELKQQLVEILTSLMDDEKIQLDISKKPAVILVIGVNGVGKTTSIAKLANHFKSQGKKVILGAGDTFRAAAIEQLEIWAQRVGVDIVKHTEGSDPAAVIFDTVQAGKARGADCIICDTAGRLHNKKHLMDELAKISRVLDRELPDTSRETLLVLDATTGQNALNQAREFKNSAAITGIILTKLDGTARGGMVISVKEELNVPVKFIGVGEKMDDLQPFNARDFANALIEP